MAEHSEARGTITALLQAWAGGDAGARDEVLSHVYAELRRCAAAYLRRESPDHTLQPTALVHEAYLRLVGQKRVAWQSRAQFFGVAAQMMRRILVDHARAQQAAKRPNPALRLPLDEHSATTPARECEVLGLDAALGDLARIDPRQAQIVELRYFAGLSEDEVAQVLSVSRSTVTREWQIARAWLFRQMTREA